MGVVLLSSYRCNILITIILVFFTLILLKITPNAESKTPQSIKVKTEFLENISGNNKFIFNVNIENNIGGVVKEFFIEQNNKVIPVGTYHISDNNYIIVVNSNDKSNKLEGVPLGVNIIVNRSEQIVKSIGKLSGENKKFVSGQVVGEPTLLYNNQDKIMIAIEINDPWDTLKSVQSTLVYPEFRKDFNTLFETKYIVSSNKLKQYVYITMEGFPFNKSFKFNISLLFQKSLNDIILRSVDKIFLYNFDTDKLIEDFIKLTYSTLLSRNIDNKTLKSCKEKLISNKISPSSFILDLVKSKEFTVLKISDEDFINKVYKIIFNRQPDKDGMNYWLGQIKKSSRVSVLEQILKSDEYIKLMNELGLKA